MITRLPRWALFFLLLLPFVPVLATDPEAEVARLVRQLGEDDFDRREAATRRLEEVGEPALDALQKALTSSDPEVRRRAEGIVAVIEDKLYGAELCLMGHAGCVTSVSLSADGKRLLTGGDDKTLRLWDADIGKCLRIFEGHTGSVHDATLSPDGKRVLSCSSDNTVRLWDADTGKELRKMTGHSQAPRSVAFGPPGKAISGGSDAAVLVWDLDTGKLARALPGHLGGVYNVAYSDRAKLAMTCSCDQTIRLWDLATGQGRTLSGHTGNVLRVRFSADDKRLFATCNLEDNVRLRDVETGEEGAPIPVANVARCALSPDSKLIVANTRSSKEAVLVEPVVRVLDTTTGKELRRYENHTGTVWNVAFFPDGKRIASTSIDGTTRVWRVPR